MSTENSDNKLATVVTVKFQYTEGGRWHSIDVPCTELLTILQTGQIDNKQICAIEVLTVMSGDDDKIEFIYDFVELSNGGNPWRVM